MEERVARWARLQAARENVSVSRYLGALLKERMHEGEEYEAAMVHYLSVKPKPMSKGHRYPGREELYDRPRVR
jgi:hypothetical protein